MRRLEEALKSVVEAEPFHFEVDASAQIPFAGMKMDLPIEIVGDFQPPDSAHATMTASVGPVSFASETIMVDGTLYFTDPATGEWQSSTSTGSVLSSPLGIIGTVGQAVESLAMVGTEVLEGIGVEVDHLTASSVIAELGGPEGEVQIDIWIGVEDSRVYQIGLEAEVPAYIISPEMAEMLGDISVALEATFAFSDFGKPVTIEVPELPESTE